MNINLFIFSSDVQSHMALSPVLYITRHTDKCFKASSEVFYLIGKDKEPHTIEETPVFPTAVKMAETTHGK